MKKILVLMFIYMSFFIFCPSKVNAAVSNIEENKTWSGEIEDSKYFYFTPKETGFYSVNKIADNADIYSIGYDITYDGRELLDISYDISDIYLVKNNKYLIQFGLYHWDADSNDSAFGGTSNVSITIEKSSKEITQLSTNETKVVESDVNEENCFVISPNETGTYTLKLGSEEYYTIYEIEEFGVVNELQGTFTEFNNDSYKINLEKEKKYLILIGPTYGKSISISINKDNKDIVGLNILDYEYCPLDSDNKTIHTGLFYNDVTYTGKFFPNIDFRDANIKFQILYSDGTFSEHFVEEHFVESIGYDEISIMYQLEVQYSGEEDYGKMKAGLQSIQVTILGSISASYNIDVKKKIDANFPKLKIDEKKTEIIGITSKNFYVITPLESGYYTLWYNTEPDSIDNIYKEWFWCVYDDQDNELEFTKNKGYKLKAGKNYVFFISLDGDVKKDEGEEFTYWFGKNTSHEHIFSDWEVIKKETEDETGEKRRICTDCGYEETMVINKLEKQKDNKTSTPNNKINEIPSTSNKKDEVGVAVLGVNKPNKITIGKISNKKKNKVVVNWKKDKYAKGYQVQYSISRKFVKAKKVEKKTCSVTLRKLIKKKTYYIRVRAYNIYNGKKVYGKWSKVKKVKIKK